MGVLMEAGAAVEQAGGPVSHRGASKSAQS